MWIGTAYDAVLFDLDGVLTPTAIVHERAWAKMFDEYFGAHGIEPAYSEADYFEHVDGRPRYDGVRAVLTSRGVELPEGDPSDASDVGDGVWSRQPEERCLQRRPCR